MFRLRITDESGEKWFVRATHYSFNSARYKDRIFQTRPEVDDFVADMVCKDTLKLEVVQKSKVVGVKPAGADIITWDKEKKK